MNEVERFFINPKIEKVASSESHCADPKPVKISLAEKSRIGEPRHPDFEKIYRQFMKRYCGSPYEECEKGKRVYYAWLNKHGLDDTKPYRKPQEKEAFTWADSIPRLAKEDKENKYYKVEALFPLSSMNRNVYTEDELIRAARTLIGKPVNINHESPPIEGVEIIDAEYEDGAVEVLLKVSRNAEFEGKKIIDMIDNGEILHVSIEGACRSRKLILTDDEVGFGCEGLVLTGLALLQKDVLPGVPLTRIEPLEKIISDLDDFMSEEKEPEKSGECIECENKENVLEREWDAAYINSLPDSAFAVIEPAYLRGETKDKRCRHLPHHNMNGEIDVPHLRNALARLNQIKPVTDSISRDDLIARAKRHLCAHLSQLGIDSDICKREAKEEKPKSPCESARESLLKRLRCIEAEIPQILNIATHLSILEERVKRLEKFVQESMGREAAKESDERTEEKAGEKPLRILTKDGFWKRFRELRSRGLSKSEAYRLTALELLETLANRQRTR